MWNKVEDGNPKKSGTYLCWLGGPNAFTGNTLDEPVVCKYDKDVDAWGNFFRVVYWQEIVPPVRG